MNTPAADIEHDSDTDSFSVVGTHDGQPIITIAGPHKASDKELCQRIADEINIGRLAIKGPVVEQWIHDQYIMRQ